MKFNTIFLSTLLFVGFVFAGCQRNVTGPERVRLSGNITWKGSPLESGELHLIPLTGSRADMSGAEIRNGHYVVVNKGGVIPGEYRVEFTANRTIAPVVMPTGDVVNYEQYLPAKWNAESTTTLVIPQQVRSLSHDFALEE